MKAISYIYLLIATIIWAFAPALVKLALNDIDPIYFLFIRFLVVCIICLPYLFFVIIKRKYSKYDLKNLFLFSLNYLYFYILQLSNYY